MPMIQYLAECYTDKFNPSDEQYIKSEKEINIKYLKESYKTFKNNAKNKKQSVINIFSNNEDDECVSRHLTSPECKPKRLKLDSIDNKNYDSFNLVEIKQEDDQSYRNYMKFSRKKAEIYLKNDESKNSEIKLDNLDEILIYESPSYSPLETLSALTPSIKEIDSNINNNSQTKTNQIDDSLTIENEDIFSQPIISQIIPLNSQFKNDLKNGFIFFDKILIDPYEKPLLYNNFEIVNEIILCSDDESQSYNLNSDKIINKFEHIINEKYELNNKKLKNLNETENIFNQNVNNDHLDSFKDCFDILNDSIDILELINEMINKVENNLDEENKREVLQKKVSIKEEKEANDEVLEMIKLIRKSNRKELINNKKSNEIRNKNPSYQDKINNNNYNATTIYSPSNSSSSKTESTNMKQNNYDIDLVKKIEYLLFTLIKDSYKNLDLKSRQINLYDLDLEQSKFLLNQHINKLNQENKKFDSELRWLILINFCHSSIDILLNCDWVCFLDMIPNFIQRYPIKKFEDDLNEILGYIDRIVSPCLKHKMKLIDLKNYIKPAKLRTLCSNLLEIKSRPRTNNKHYKVLIIVTRDNLQLHQSLKSEIEKTTFMKVSNFMFSSKSNMVSFENHLKSTLFDCLIVNNNIKLSDYVSYFTDAIIYEKQHGVNDMIEMKLNFLKENCQKNHINFFEFDSYKIDFDLLNSLDEISDDINDKIMFKRQLIVSKAVIESSFLVSLLETDMKFILFERNFNQYVDLLLSETAGIILFDRNEDFSLNELRFKQLFEGLNKSKLSLKYLFLIIYSDSADGIKTNLNDSRFITLFNYCQENNKDNMCKIKLIQLYGNNKSYLIECIEDIYSFCLFKRQSISLCSFPKLDLEPKREEIELLKMPCFNSFSAQYILQSNCINYKLDKLAKLENRMALNEFPLIEKYSIDSFWKK